MTNVTPATRFNALFFTHPQPDRMKRDTSPTFAVSVSTSSRSSRVSGEISPNSQRYYPFTLAAVTLCVQSEKK